MPVNPALAIDEYSYRVLSVEEQNRFQVGLADLESASSTKGRPKTRQMLYRYGIAPDLQSLPEASGLLKSIVGC